VICTLKGVKKNESHTRIFTEYKMLTLTSLFSFDILSYIKQNSDLTYNSDIHKYEKKRISIHPALQYSVTEEKCNKYGNESV
jgi:hypothetical protein